jgi:hypothetical protein
MELVPHDDHDEQLIAQMLAVSVGERLDSLEEESEFFSATQEVRRDSRT